MTSTIDTQAAFDRVAEVLSQHAANLIMEGNAAPTSEQCLNHLVMVCQMWGYNAARIIAHAEMIAEQNAFIYEIEGDRHDG